MAFYYDFINILVTFLDHSVKLVTIIVKKLREITRTKENNCRWWN